MVVNGILLVMSIIFSGSLFLVGFILFVVKASDNSPKKWNWLIVAIISLAILIGSIFFFVRKVMNKVSEFGANIGQQFEKSVENLKNQNTDYHYNLLDSIPNNPTLVKLKSFENDSASAPKEFYVYFGFQDYYRMPLKYPYALHCTDILEKASLYDEKNVSEFNISDNGETDCGLSEITEFAFNNKIIIAKQNQKQADKEIEKFIIYEFSSGNKTDCSSQKEAFTKAKKQFGYNGPDTMVSVLKYYRLFN